MSKRYPSSILVSCEVPWDENRELIEDTFRAEIRDAMETYNNLYIFGTAGEGYAITLSRFKEIVGIFREETNRPDVHPMVGIISMSTTWADNWSNCTRRTCICCNCCYGITIIITSSNNHNITNSTSCRISSTNICSVSVTSNSNFRADRISGAVFGHV